MGSSNWVQSGPSPETLTGSITPSNTTFKVSETHKPLHLHHVMVVILLGVRINGAWHVQAFVMQLRPVVKREMSRRKKLWTYQLICYVPPPVIQWREHHPRPAAVWHIRLTSSRPNIQSRLARISLSRTMFLLLWTCTSWWVRSFHGWRTRWRFGKSGRRRLTLTTKDSLLNSEGFLMDVLNQLYLRPIWRRYSRSYMVPACLKASTQDHQNLVSSWFKPSGSLCQIWGNSLKVFLRYCVHGCMDRNT